MKAMLLAALVILLVAGAVWALSAESMSPSDVVQATEKDGRFQFVGLSINQMEGVPTRWDHCLVDTATGDVWVWPYGEAREFVHVDRVDPTPSE